MGASRGGTGRWLGRLAVLNLLANIGIVVTGGAVRLTGSGLGCPTWPRCTEASYVVHGELGLHGAIEFGNRMLTFVVAAVAIACVGAAWRAGGRRATRLSAVVALGVPAQALIGGLTVLTDLNPWIVALHLLVSMAMIGVCVWLVRLVWGRDRPPPVPPRVRRGGWLTFGAGWLVLYLGTVVTGSGPHAGDEHAERNGLDPQLMSHVHAVAVYLLVALTVGLLVLAVRHRLAALQRATGLLLAVEVAQGGVGFAQYHLGLPALLVGLHLLGAALTSAALANMLLCARAAPGGAPDGGGRAELSGSAAGRARPPRTAG